MIKIIKRLTYEVMLTIVSRFARNTVDTLQYTRDLKRLGAEVFVPNCEQDFCAGRQ